MGQIFVPLSAHATPTVAELTIASTEPRIVFDETDAAANQKLWDVDINAGVLSIRTRTDADGAGEDVLSVTRVATGITTIVLGNHDTLDATITLNHAQVLLEADDEVDFIAGIVTFSASGLVGSAIQMNCDGAFNLSAGEVNAGNVSIATANGDVTLQAGGADGDVNLNIAGTGTITLGTQLGNFANDAAAAAGGIPVRGLYRNGSVVMIRVV